MAQTLEQLVLRLDAETAQYRAELEKAQKQLEGLGEKVDSIAKKVDAAFQKAIVDAAKSAVEAIVGLAEKGGELAERMEHLAQVTGISTEQIAQLDFAARATGTSGESLATGFSKLEKTMAAAAAKNGEARAAFRALGIEYESAPGKLRPVNDVLEALSKKMGDYKDGAAKTAAAQLLMGKGAAELIPYLNRLGKEGFAALAAEAKSFGAELGGQTIRNAAEFKETLSKMQGGVETLSVRLASNLKPALEALASRFKDLASGGETFEKIAKAGAFAINLLATAGEVAITKLSILGRTIGAALAAATSGSLAAGIAILEGNANRIRELNLKLAIDVAKIWEPIKFPTPGADEDKGKKNAPIIPDTKPAQEAIKNLTHEIDTLQAKISGLKGATEGTILNIAEFTPEKLGAKAFEELTEKAKEADKSFADLSYRIHSGDIEKKLDLAGGAAFGLAEKLKHAAAEINALEKLKIIADEAGKAQKGLGEELEQLNAKLRQIPHETELQRVSWELAHGKLRDYIEALKLAGQNVDGLAEKFLAMAAKVDRTNAAVKDISTVFEHYRAVLAEATKTVEGLGESGFKKFAEDLRALHEQFEVGGLTIRQYGLSVAKLALDFTDLSTVGKEAAQALTDSFAEFILHTSEGFSGLLANFAKLMEQILAKWLATKIVMGTLDLLWTGILGVVGGGAGAAAGEATGAVASSASGLAAGGPATAGTPYVVGEHGPELFVPGASGRVVPNHDFSSLFDEGVTGGGDTHNHFHATAKFESLHPSTITDNQRWMQRDFIPAFDQMARTGQLDSIIRRVVRGVVKQ